MTIYKPIVYFVSGWSIWWSATILVSNKNSTWSSCWKLSQYEIWWLEVEDTQSDFVQGKKSLYIRGFTKFGIKVAWSLQFLGYLRTLRLKFQKAQTKIGVFLGLPSWLSQFSWDSQKGRPRKTPVLVRAFWNFKRKVLKYPRNCRLHATLIPNLVKPLIYILSFQQITK